MFSYLNIFSMVVLHYNSLNQSAEFSGILRNMKFSVEMK